MKQIGKLISFGKYSGQIRISGLLPDFDVPNAHKYCGKTLYFEPDVYERLEQLDSERKKYYYDAMDLSEELFESAIEKDTTEHWRDRDCVNFDFDAYISGEPRFDELTELWENARLLKNEMLKIIKSCLQLSFPN